MLRFANRDNNSDCYPSYPAFRFTGMLTTSPSLFVMATVALSRIIIGKNDFFSNIRCVYVVFLWIILFL